MKLMVVSVVVVFMLLAVDGAYGMGGGGSRGDGRLDFTHHAGNGDPSPANSNAQDPPKVSNGNSGGPDNGFVMTSLVSVSVPEPVTVFLLGLGIVGLAGIRRKFRK